MLSCLLPQKWLAPKSNAFNTKKTISISHNRWMEELSDKCSLAEITIPGTHNSAATKGILNFAFGVCQKKNISTQLDMGIRFLDIRCRHVKKSLLLCHGPIDLGQTFDNVLKTVSEFLTKNPSECVIICLRHEVEAGDKGNGNQSFSETFRGCIASYEKMMWLEEEIPKLGDVRGKIVIMTRFRYTGKLGIIRDNCKVCDDWEYTDHTKMQNITKNIESCNKSQGKSIYITHVNTYSKLYNPDVYAAKFNPKIMSLGGLMGIVVLDFPGEGLVDHLIKQNSSIDKSGIYLGV